MITCIVLEILALERLFVLKDTLRFDSVEAFASPSLWIWIGPKGLRRLLKPSGFSHRSAPFLLRDEPRIYPEFVLERCNLHAATEAAPIYDLSLKSTFTQSFLCPFDPNKHRFAASSNQSATAKKETKDSLRTLAIQWATWSNTPQSRLRLFALIACFASLLTAFATPFHPHLDSLCGLAARFRSDRLPNFAFSSPISTASLLRFALVLSKSNPMDWLSPTTKAAAKASRLLRQCRETRRVIEVEFDQSWKGWKNPLRIRWNGRWPRRIQWESDDRLKEGNEKRVYEG